MSFSALFFSSKVFLTGVCAGGTILWEEQDALPMPSVNQRWGLTHDWLWSINCFSPHLPAFSCTSLYAPVRRYIHLHHPHWLRLMCLAFFGGWAPQWGPPLLTNRPVLDVWLSCSDEPEEMCIIVPDALIICLHPLGPLQSTNSVIDLLLMRKPIALSSFQVLFYYFFYCLPFFLTQSSKENEKGK